MPQPDSTISTNTRSRRPSRWLCGVLLVFMSLSGFIWWRVTQLNELEQQFVGHWTTTEQYEDGSTCTRTWQLRKDRSLHYRNQYHWVATQGRPARNQTEEGVMSWSIREGRLLVNPNHPTPEQLKVLWMLTRWRAQNAINGVSETWFKALFGGISDCLTA